MESKAAAITDSAAALVQLALPSKTAWAPGDSAVCHSAGAAEQGSRFRGAEQDFIKATQRTVRSAGPLATLEGLLAAGAALADAGAPISALDAAYRRAVALLLTQGVQEEEGALVLPPSAPLHLVEVFSRTLLGLAEVALASLAPTASPAAALRTARQASGLIQGAVGAITTRPSAVREALYWLVYNGVSLAMRVARLLLASGRGSCLGSAASTPFAAPSAAAPEAAALLTWALHAVQATLILCGTPYLPWRVSLWAAASQAHLAANSPKGAAGIAAHGLAATRQLQAELAMDPPIPRSAVAALDHARFRLQAMATAAHGLVQPDLALRSAVAAAPSTAAGLRTALASTLLLADACPQAMAAALGEVAPQLAACLVPFLALRGALLGEGEAGADAEGGEGGSASTPPLTLEDVEASRLAAALPLALHCQLAEASAAVTDTPAGQWHGLLSLTAEFRVWGALARAAGFAACSTDMVGVALYLPLLRGDPAVDGDAVEDMAAGLGLRLVVTWGVQGLSFTLAPPHPAWPTGTPLPPPEGDVEGGVHLPELDESGSAGVTPPLDPDDPPSLVQLHRLQMSGKCLALRRAVSEATATPGVWSGQAAALLAPLLPAPSPALAACLAGLEEEGEEGASDVAGGSASLFPPSLALSPHSADTLAAVLASLLRQPGFNIVDSHPGLVLQGAQHLSTAVLALEAWRGAGSLQLGHCGEDTPFAAAQRASVVRCAIRGWGTAALRGVLAVARRGAPLSPADAGSVGRLGIVVAVLQAEADDVSGALQTLVPVEEAVQRSLDSVFSAQAVLGSEGDDDAMAHAAPTRAQLTTLAAGMPLPYAEAWAHPPPPSDDSLHPMPGAAQHLHPHAVSGRSEGVRGILSLAAVHADVLSCLFSLDLAAAARRVGRAREAALHATQGRARLEEEGPWDTYVRTSALPAGCVVGEGGAPAPLPAAVGPPPSAMSTGRPGSTFTARQGTARPGTVTSVTGGATAVSAAQPATAAAGTGATAQVHGVAPQAMARLLSQAGANPEWAVLVHLASLPHLPTAVARREALHAAETSLQQAASAAAQRWEEAWGPLEAEGGQRAAPPLTHRSPPRLVTRCSTSATLLLPHPAARDDGAASGKASPKYGTFSTSHPAVALLGKEFGSGTAVTLSAVDLPGTGRFLVPHEPGQRPAALPALLQASLWGDGGVTSALPGVPASASGLTRNTTYNFAAAVGHMPAALQEGGAALQGSGQLPPDLVRELGALMGPGSNGDSAKPHVTPSTPSILAATPLPLPLLRAYLAVEAARVGEWAIARAAAARVALPFLALAGGSMDPAAEDPLAWIRLRAGRLRSAPEALLAPLAQCLALLVVTDVGGAGALLSPAAHTPQDTRPAETALLAALSGGHGAPEAAAALVHGVLPPSDGSGAGGRGVAPARRAHIAAALRAVTLLHAGQVALTAHLPLLAGRLVAGAWWETRPLAGQAASGREFLALARGVMGLACALPPRAWTPTLRSAHAQCGGALLRRGSPLLVGPSGGWGGPLPALQTALVSLGMPPPAAVGWQAAMAAAQRHGTPDVPGIMAGLGWTVGSDGLVLRSVPEQGSGAELGRLTAHVAGMTPSLALLHAVLEGQVWRERAAAPGAVPASGGGAAKPGTKAPAQEAPAPPQPDTAHFDPWTLLPPAPPATTCTPEQAARHALASVAIAATCAGLPVGTVASAPVQAAVTAALTTAMAAAPAGEGAGKRSGSPSSGKRGGGRGGKGGKPPMAPTSPLPIKPAREVDEGAWQAPPGCLPPGALVSAAAQHCLQRLARACPLLGVVAALRLARSALLVGGVQPVGDPDEEEGAEGRGGAPPAAPDASTPDLVWQPSLQWCLAQLNWALRAACTGCSLLGSSETPLPPSSGKGAPPPPSTPASLLPAYRAVAQQLAELADQGTAPEVGGWTKALLPLPHPPSMEAAMEQLPPHALHANWAVGVASLASEVLGLFTAVLQRGLPGGLGRLLRATRLSTASPAPAQAALVELWHALHRHLPGKEGGDQAATAAMAGPGAVAVAEARQAALDNPVPLSVPLAQVGVRWEDVLAASAERAPGALPTSGLSANHRHVLLCLARLQATGLGAGAAAWRGVVGRPLPSWAASWSDASHSGTPAPRGPSTGPLLDVRQLCADAVQQAREVAAADAAAAAHRAAGLEVAPGDGPPPPAALEPVPTPSLPCPPPSLDEAAVRRAWSRCAAGAPGHAVLALVEGCASPQQASQLATLHTAACAAAVLHTAADAAVLGVASAGWGIVAEACDGAWAHITRHHVQPQAWHCMSPVGTAPLDMLPSLDASTLQPLLGEGVTEAEAAMPALVTAAQEQITAAAQAVTGSCAAVWRLGAAAAALLRGVASGGIMLTHGAALATAGLHPTAVLSGEVGGAAPLALQEDVQGESVDDQDGMVVAGEDEGGSVEGGGSPPPTPTSRVDIADVLDAARLLAWCQGVLLSAWQWEQAGELAAAAAGVLEGVLAAAGTTRGTSPVAGAGPWSGVGTSHSHAPRALVNFSGAWDVPSSVVGGTRLDTWSALVRGRAEAAAASAAALSRSALAGDIQEALASAVSLGTTAAQCSAAVAVQHATTLSDTSAQLATRLQALLDSDLRRKRRQALLVDDGQDMLNPAQRAVDLVLDREQAALEALARAASTRTVRAEALEGWRQALRQSTPAAQRSLAAAREALEDLAAAASASFEEQGAPLADRPGSAGGGGHMGILRALRSPSQRQTVTFHPAPTPTSLMAQAGDVVAAYEAVLPALRARQDTPALSAALLEQGCAAMSVGGAGAAAAAAAAWGDALDACFGHLDSAKPGVWQGLVAGMVPRGGDVPPKTPAPEGLGAGVLTRMGACGPAMAATAAGLLAATDASLNEAERDACAALAALLCGVGEEGEAALGGRVWQHSRLLPLPLFVLALRHCAVRLLSHADGRYTPLLLPLLRCLLHVTRLTLASPAQTLQVHVWLALACARGGDLPAATGHLAKVYGGDVWPGQAPTGAAGQTGTLADKAVTGGVTRLPALPPNVAVGSPAALPTLQWLTDASLVPDEGVLGAVPGDLVQDLALARAEVLLACARQTSATAPAQPALPPCSGDAGVAMDGGVWMGPLPGTDGTSPRPSSTSSSPRSAGKRGSSKDKQAASATALLPSAGAWDGPPLQASAMGLTQQLTGASIALARRVAAQAGLLRAPMPDVRGRWALCSLMGSAEVQEDSAAPSPRAVRAALLIGGARLVAGQFHAASAAAAVAGELLEVLSARAEQGTASFWADGGVAAHPPLSSPAGCTLWLQCAQLNIAALLGVGALSQAAEAAGLAVVAARQAHDVTAELNCSLLAAQAQVRLGLQAEALATLHQALSRGLAVGEGVMDLLIPALHGGMSGLQGQLVAGAVPLATLAATCTATATLLRQGVALAEQGTDISTPSAASLLQRAVHLLMAGGAAQGKVGALAMASSGTASPRTGWLRREGCTAFAPALAQALHASAQHSLGVLLTAPRVQAAHCEALRQGLAQSRLALGVLDAVQHPVDALRVCVHLSIAHALRQCAQARLHTVQTERVAAAAHDDAVMVQTWMQEAEASLTAVASALASDAALASTHAKALWQEVAAVRCVALQAQSTLAPPSPAAGPEESPDGSAMDSPVHAMWTVDSVSVLAAVQQCLALQGRSSPAGLDVPAAALPHATRAELAVAAAAEAVLDSEVTLVAQGQQPDPRVEASTVPHCVDGVPAGQVHACLQALRSRAASSMVPHTCHLPPALAVLGTAVHDVTAACLQRAMPSEEQVLAGEGGVTASAPASCQQCQSVWTGPNPSACTSHRLFTVLLPSPAAPAVPSACPEGLWVQVVAVVGGPSPEAQPTTARSRKSTKDSALEAAAVEARHATLHTVPQAALVQAAGVATAAADAASRSLTQFARSGRVHSTLQQLLSLGQMLLPHSRLVPGSAVQEGLRDVLVSLAGVLARGGGSLPLQVADDDSEAKLQ